MISDRIARYQHEREVVFRQWHKGMIGREMARAAISTITGWIERMGKERERC